MSEAEPPKRALTTSEKRAARRARVLQSGDDRLKLLKGQLQSLKTPADEQKLDDGVNELLAEASEPSGAPAELKIPPRVDPAQRRRDAAARRRKKEKMVQQMLGQEPQDEQGQGQEASEQPIKAEASVSTSGPTYSRHSTALKLLKLEEKLVLFLLVLAAVYAALGVDLRPISASLTADDALFVSYQDLIAQGVSLDAIRQQVEREQVQPEVKDKLEMLLTQQLKMEATGTSGASGWLPDVADLGFFFTSLVAHPPIVLCVLIVRLLVATGAKALHKALDLPEVKNPQEADLGFVANLVLSSRPVLKGTV
jgi:hypothetical protein